jgi:hypothetical protein
MKLWYFPKVQTVAACAGWVVVGRRRVRDLATVGGWIRRHDCWNQTTRQDEEELMENTLR